MFTSVKVRADQAAGDYRDPGWFKQTPGTQAYEFTGALANPPTRAGAPAGPTPLTVRKPAGHSGH
jgi:hypothetical protein